MYGISNFRRQNCIFAPAVDRFSDLWSINWSQDDVGSSVAHCIAGIFSFAPTEGLDMSVDAPRSLAACKSRLDIYRQLYSALCRRTRVSGCFADSGFYWDGGGDWGDFNDILEGIKATKELYEWLLTKLS